MISPHCTPSPQLCGGVKCPASYAPQYIALARPLPTASVVNASIKLLLAQHCIFLGYRTRRPSRTKTNIAAPVSSAWRRPSRDAGMAHSYEYGCCCVGNSTGSVSSLMPRVSTYRTATPRGLSRQLTTAVCNPEYLVIGLSILNRICTDVRALRKVIYPPDRVHAYKYIDKTVGISPTSTRCS